MGQVNRHKAWNVSKDENYLIFVICIIFLFLDDKVLSLPLHSSQNVKDIITLISFYMALMNVSRRMIKIRLQ